MREVAWAGAGPQALFWKRQPVCLPKTRYGDCDERTVIIRVTVPLTEDQ